MDTKVRNLWLGFAGVFFFALLVAAKRPGLVANPKFLSAIVLAEVIVFCLWRYEDRFFPFLIFVFLWAGGPFPYRDSASTIRWVVLAIAAGGGFVVWLRSKRYTLGSFHFAAIACILTGFASSLVSSNPVVSDLKVASLGMLFLYAVTGGRAVFWQDPQKFIHRLTTGAQALVFVSGFSYLVLRVSLFGNPNSLGAVMGFVEPLLLWHVLVARETKTRYLRTAALLISGALLYVSAARAALLAAGLATVILCVALRHYKVLPKIALVSLLLISLAGVMEPERFPDLLRSMTGNLIYKKNVEAGLLGSRMTPWTQAVGTIKAHPWFGSGFGTRTAPSMGDASPIYSSIHNFEYGSSYLGILDYTGIVGTATFGTLILLLLWRVGVIAAAVRRNPELVRTALPLMLIVIVGLIHAMFEDWLFAAGSYICIFFWCCAFLFMDFVPSTAQQPAFGAARRFRYPAGALLARDLRARPGI